MKKKLFLAAIPILAFGLLFTACSTGSDDDGPSPTPIDEKTLAGSYKVALPAGEESLPSTLTFKDGDWSITADEDGSLIAEGTYTIPNGTTAVLIEKENDEKMAEVQMFGDGSLLIIIDDRNGPISVWGEKVKEEE